MFATETQRAQRISALGDLVRLGVLGGLGLVNYMLVSLRCFGRFADQVLVELRSNKA